MASSGQTIITGIEFGTDKICVIHGRPDQNGNIEVLSFASLPSRNSVVKGTIIDQNAVLNILKSVLDESEKGLGWKFSRTEQQAKAEGFYFVTHDPMFRGYNENCVIEV